MGERILSVEGMFPKETIIIGLKVVHDKMLTVTTIISGVSHIVTGRDIHPVCIKTTILIDKSRVKLWSQN